MLQPPARVDEATTPIRGRELIFVMDTSGSMSGLPVEKSKAVISRAIDAMRPNDTFNLITFSGDTHILWDTPRPATAENRAVAQQFVESRSGGGGTEMMKAIHAALVQQPADRAAGMTLRQLVDLPADGRAVEIALRELQGEVDQPAADPLFIERPDAEANPIRTWLHGFLISARIGPGFWDNTIKGTWETRNGERVLVFTGWGTTSAAGKPMRIVMFLTDGYVGNDMEIIQAVRDNAKTTRVFSFGIGNSVNRYLLDSMARAGRGEVEYVLLNSNADEAVNRFTKRVQTPVLTDIELQFSDELKIAGLLTGDGVEISENGLIPDLYDVKPLIVHGRYATPGKGSLKVSGQSGGELWTRTIDLDLPAQRDVHDVIATLWARAKVESVMSRDLNAVQQGTPPEDMRQEIVALGERYQIMTQFTSFVAVEKSRITIEGQPMLVNIPIELPAGTRWEGFFGPGAPGNGECDFRDVAEEVVYLGLPLQATSSDQTIQNLQDDLAMDVFEPSAAGNVGGWFADSDGDGSAELAKDRLILPGAKPLVQEGVPVTVLRAEVNGYESLGREVMTLGQARGRESELWAYRVAPQDNWLPDPSASSMYFHVGTRQPPLPPSSPPTSAGVPVTLGETLRLQQLNEGRQGFAPEGGVAESGFLAWQVANAPTFEPEDSRGGSDRLETRVAAGGFGFAAADPPANANELARVHHAVPDSTTTSGGEAKAGEVEVRRALVDAVASYQQLREPPAASEDAAAAQSSPVVRAPADFASIVQPAPIDLLRSLFGTTKQPYFAQRVALLIAGLVEHDEFDTARTLLDALLAFDGNFEIGRQMCAALDDPALDAAAKKTAVAKLAEQARQHVIDAVEAQLREARIRDVLDPALHMFAFGQGAPDTLDGIYDGPVPPPQVATVIGTGVRVTILARDINDDLLEAIRELGFKVEDTAEDAKLIVGLAPFGRLDDLAILAGVRRIEPTRFAVYEAAHKRG
jgi:hypothetical protein